MPAPTAMPNIQDNPDGWGPCAVPDHLKDVPFAPFSKTDKLGKAADWTQQAYQRNQGRYGANPANAVFQFFHTEEEDSFHLVDNRPAKATKFGQRRFQQNKFAQQRREREAARAEREKREGGGPRQQQKKNPWQQHWREQQRQVQYSSSVDIRPEWAVKEQIPFASLAKLTCNVGAPKDMYAAGQLEYYDKAYDKLTTRQEKPLERTKRAFRSVSTSDDPIIRNLASEDAGRVFVTDAILTTIMCAAKSVYSWDVVVTRVGDKLFFDKREGSSLDLLTVNETAPEQVPEDKDNINGVQQLSLEATMINQNLSQQLLVKGGEKFNLGNSNPFGDGGEELASVGYKYRRWALNAEAGIDIVVRCEIDGVINNKGEDQLLSIKALNEFDLRATDWRKKLESQRGAVLAFETKNNLAKIAKWTMCALLAGADMVKLGYVSRAGPKDNSNHVILGTQTSKPRDLATQMSLNPDHCWGIVRALVDMLLRQPEGKYLLVKDPNKDLLRLYAVPEDAFETNYVEEPLADPDEVPADAAPAAAADEAGDE
ncbi:eukaryotic translation initiation factor 3, subunit 7 [Scenedesmus sp. NREL 46B-D3]|nr:eukaryotic translation initiation factor 3, subunit 7 [Scenedesmus sp. NREL 46B-D3]